MTTNIPDLSVIKINDYVYEAHRGSVRCVYDEVKGRILIADRDFAPGQPIFIDKPLHFVLTDEKNPIFMKLTKLYEDEIFSLKPLWYWCALNSLLINDNHSESSNPVADGASHQISHDTHIPQTPQLAGRYTVSQSNPPLDSGITSQQHTPSNCDTVSQIYHPFDGYTVSQPHPPLIGYVSRLKRVSRIQQIRLLSLYAPPTNKTSREVNIIFDELDLHGVCDPLLFEALVQTWVFNCFEFSYSPLGYGIYYLPSFLSHSCCPNAIWAYDNQTNFVLTSRLYISAGDEIDISYLSECCLIGVTPKRQSLLETTKGFKCSCSRCICSADRSRGFRCTQCSRGTIFIGPTLCLNSDSTCSSPTCNLPKCKLRNTPSVCVPKSQSPHFYVGSDIGYSINSGQIQLLPDIDKEGEDESDGQFWSYFYDQSFPLYNECNSNVSHLERLVRDTCCDVCMHCGYEINDMERHSMLFKEKVAMRNLKLFRLRKSQKILEVTDDEDASDSNERGNTSYCRDNISGYGTEIKLFFGQHQVRLIWHRMMADELEKQNNDLGQIHHLKKIVELECRMYPGPIASAAWTMESVGDKYRQLISRTEYNCETGNAFLQLAISFYLRSCSILQMIFGTDNEDRRTTMKKLEYVLDELGRQGRTS